MDCDLRFDICVLFFTKTLTSYTKYFQVPTFPSFIFVSSQSRNLSCYAIVLPSPLQKTYVVSTKK